MMLNTGLLITIQVNLSTIDIENMLFDKYLIGKVPDHISDGILNIQKKYLFNMQIKLITQMIFSCYNKGSLDLYPY